MTGLYAFPSLKDFDFEENDTSIIIHGKSARDREVCPRCGAEKQVRKDGNYIRKVVDFPIRNKQVVLYIHTFRYECCNPSCSKRSFIPQFPDIVDQKGKITLRLKEAIANSDFSKRTFEDVARQFFVDKETVRRVFMSKSAELDKKVKYEPVISLGIDEAHLANEMRCVLVDGSSKKAKLIDILPTRKKDDVIHALSNFQNAESIKYVTMDMYMGYREAVLEALPNAKIVIDRYHVIFHLLDATEKARKAVCEIIEDDILKHHPEDFEKWKRTDKNHYWFKKNVNNLTDRQLQGLASLCNQYPIFSDIISIKEKFSSIYEYKARQDAEGVFQDWLKEVNQQIADPQFGDAFRYFIDFSQTVLRWKEYIFNFFEVEDGVSRTNGPVEAINGEIKRINRTGRGYQFDVLRAKLLYGNTTITFAPNIVNTYGNIKEAFLANLNHFLDYNSFGHFNYSSRKILLIYSLALKLHPELSEKFDCMHEYISAGDTIMLQEYSWSDDKTLHDALYEAASFLDSNSIGTYIKSGLPIEQLSLIVTIMTAQIQIGEDADYVISYS